VQIINGPKYQLVLKGSGYKPKLHFSFLNHNFGPCHVWQQGMTPSSVNLVVQNQDKQAVGIDVLFDNTDNWQVSSCALPWWQPAISAIQVYTCAHLGCSEQTAVGPTNASNMLLSVYLISGGGQCLILLQ
jgi:hypothetical protein